MLQIEFRAFGAAIRVLVDSEDASAADALARAPDWFERWEARLSRFRADSELSRLNRRRGHWVAVGATLWRVARRAAWAARLSGGLVVPHLLDDLVRAGYDRPFGQPGDLQVMPAPGDMHHPPLGVAHPVSGSRHAPRLRRRGRRIRLSRHAGLDLAGVAKAWAGQTVARRIARHGPTLVDVGGDVVVTSPPRGSAGWPVGVDLPQGLREIVLTAGGVATSGTDFRRWRRDGEWRHHIIDPRTGRPALTDVSTATVVAPTLLEADVAAKVLLILGCREGTAWLAARPRYAAILALTDGRVVDTGF